MVAIRFFNQEGSTARNIVDFMTLQEVRSAKNGVALSPELLEEFRHQAHGMNKWFNVRISIVLDSVLFEVIVRGPPYPRMGYMFNVCAFRAARLNILGLGSRSCPVSYAVGPDVDDIAEVSGPRTVDIVVGPRVP